MPQQFILRLPDRQPTFEELQAVMEEMVEYGLLYRVTTGGEEPRYWLTPAGWAEVSDDPYPGLVAME
jgi:hypothetical protein